MDISSHVIQHVDSSVWAFAASVLLISIFFKFNRFWSVRNLDLCLIILMAPFLLMVHQGMTMSSQFQLSRPVGPAVAASDADDANANDIFVSGPTSDWQLRSQSPLQSPLRSVAWRKPMPVAMPIQLTPAPDRSPATLADVAKDRDALNDSARETTAGNGLASDGLDGNEAAAPTTSDATLPVAPTSSIVELDAKLPPPAQSPGGSPTDVADPEDPGRELQRRGFVGLFIVGALYLIRMLVDPVLVRRPLLNPNLSLGGLIFLGSCLMLLLFANIFSSNPTRDELSMVKSTIRMANRESASEKDSQYLRKRGPGYQVLFLVAVISVFSDSDESGEVVITPQQNLDRYDRYVLVLRIIATISQILIVTGLILFAVYNFDSFYIGVGIASVYLLLPYTAAYTGHVEHALPAALMLWALVCFRKPALAGLFIGLATGASYYPIFLLPLWLSFYWDRGRKRFALFFGLAILISVLALIFTSLNVGDFFLQLQKMFGFWQPLMEGLEGIWALGWDRVWRLPLLVAFVALCISFTVWPAKKDIGVLIAYSGAIMIGVQFWHGFGGGLFAAWYLPMMLLVFFRTNLTGRTAINELPALRSAGG